MGSQRAVAAEFAGCLLLALTAGLLPLLNLEGLDFALALSLGYGVLLVGLKEMGARSLNPALTVADMLKGNVDTALGGLVILAQFAGATVGALLLSAALHSSSAFPAVESPQLGQAMLTQLTFCCTLVFAFLRGEGRSRYDGLWLGALMYGAFIIGSGATVYLNPAMALAVAFAQGTSGVAVDEKFLAVLVILPLLAAGAGFLLEKAASQDLRMSELLGTFFLSFAIFAAASNESRNAAVGLAFFSAATIRMIAPLSGGSLNPAVTAGALLCEGRSISNEDVTIWLFQLVGGALAAVMAKQAVGSLPRTVVLLSGKGEVLLVALGICGLLMFSYFINFGDFFGSPAAALIGAVYGGSIAAAKSGVPINPVTALGATVVELCTGKSPDALEAAAGVLVPVLGCMAGAALLRFVPSEYRRRL